MKTFHGINHLAMENQLGRATATAAIDNIGFYLFPDGRRLILSDSGTPYWTWNTLLDVNPQVVPLIRCNTQNPSTTAEGGTFEFTAEFD